MLFLENPDDELLKKVLYLLELKDNTKTTGFIKEKVNKTRTRSVFRFEINGDTYYCKKYVNYSYLKMIQDFFRAPRAVRAFKISQFLNENSIKTAIPVLAVYKSFGKSSVFITKEGKGETLEDLLINEISEVDKSELLMKLINMYKSLVKLNIFHRDLNFSNLILFNEEFALIDMDDIRKIIILPSLHLFGFLEKFNRTLLLSSIYKEKDIKFNNENRIFVMKALINHFYNQKLATIIMKLLNLFTRYKMRRFFKKKNNVKRYLLGGTIEEVNNYLFSKNMGKFTKRVLKIL